MDRRPDPTDELYDFAREAFACDDYEHALHFLRKASQMAPMRADIRQFMSEVLARQEEQKRRAESESRPAPVPVPKEVMMRGAPGQSITPGSRPVIIGGAGAGMGGGATSGGAGAGSRASSAMSGNSGSTPASGIVTSGLRTPTGSLLMGRLPSHGEPASGLGRVEPVGLRPDSGLADESRYSDLPAPGSLDSDTMLRAAAHNATTGAARMRFEPIPGGAGEGGFHRPAESAGAAGLFERDMGAIDEESHHLWSGGYGARAGGGGIDLDSAAAAEMSLYGPRNAVGSWRGAGVEFSRAAIDWIGSLPRPGRRMTFFACAYSVFVIFAATASIQCYRKFFRSTIATHTAATASEAASTVGSGSVLMAWPATGNSSAPPASHTAAPPPASSARTTRAVASTLAALPVATPRPTPDPAEAAAALASARRALDSGKLQEAAKLVANLPAGVSASAVSSLKEDLAAALTKEGTELLTASEFESAVASYRKAVDLDPGRAKFLFLLGNGLYYAGKSLASESDKAQLREAAKTLQKSIDLDAKNDEALRCLGDTQMLLGKSSEARQSWKRALEVLQEKVKTGKSSDELQSRIAKLQKNIAESSPNEGGGASAGETNSASSRPAAASAGASGNQGASAATSDKIAIQPSHLTVPPTSRRGSGARNSTKSPARAN